MLDGELDFFAVDGSLWGREELVLLQWQSKVKKIDYQKNAFK